MTCKYKEYIANYNKNDTGTMTTAKITFLLGYELILNCCHFQILHLF